MKSQSGKQIIATHIFPNISRSTGNQITKFGQLIKYNMRSIFLEKSFTKCGGETIHRPFPKKSILSTVSFYCMPSKLRLRCRPLVSTSNKAFLKNKKRPRTSLPATFSAWFLKNIFLVTFYYLTKFHGMVVFILWDIA